MKKIIKDNTCFNDGFRITTDIIKGSQRIK